MQSPLSPREIFSHDKTHAVQTSFEENLLRQVSSGDWDMSSLDFMIPPKSTWPKIEPMSEGGFNGVYLDSYLVTLKPTKSEADVHVWVRRRAGGLLSVALLGAQGSVRIESLEHATQRTGAVLKKALADNSRLARSADELVSAFLSEVA